MQNRRRLTPEQGDQRYTVLQKKFRGRQIHCRDVFGATADNSGETDRVCCKPIIADFLCLVRGGFKCVRDKGHQVCALARRHLIQGLAESRIAGSFGR